MATTTEDQTLDYQHFIDYQLTHAQGRMKSVEVGTGVVRIITAILVYLIAVIVLDHVLVLPSAVRLAFLLIALAAAVGYFAIAVIMPGIRRINNFYTARTIEQATPEFKNSLINFLDLRRHPDDVPRGVLSMLEERAVADLSRVHVDDKINHDRLVRACYGLAGAVLVTCAAVLINALFMHRSLGDSIGRALFPTAEIQPPTRTRLSDVKPGDKTVVAHTPVQISAIADGRQPEQVTLHWSDDGGKFWHEQPMNPPGSQFDPWSVELLVEKPSRYFLSGGDCRTREFAIDVTQPPMVTELEVVYDYPEYTGWARHTNRNGNIDALENTTVTITATTNRPAANGQIRFGSTKSTGPGMIHAPDRNDRLIARFTITKDDSYVIWFETENGETNPRPTSYEIKVRLDLPPTVTVKPGTDQVDPPVPANAIVPIGVTAGDDFGIDEVKLNVARGQETLDSIDLMADVQTGGKEFTTTHRLDLQKLGVAAGEEITYWVEVADNRQPKRNRIPSQHYRIRLGSPLSPEERQDAEKRQVELAKADDAERAAKAAEQSPDEPQQPEPAPGEPKEPGTESGDKEPTPKDERAFDVIRKFLEEQARQEQMEKERGPDPTNDKQEGKSGDEKDAGSSKDSEGSSKQESKGEGAEGTGSEKSDKGEKPAEGKQDDGKPGSEKSASGEKGDPKAGSDKPGNDKSDGDTPGKEKSDSSKPSSEKPSGDKSGDAKDGTSGDNAKASDKQNDDSPTKEKSEGQKSDGEKAPSTKPGSEKSDDPSMKDEKGTGDRSEGDKSGGEKPKGDKTAGEKTDGEKSAGEKAGGNKKDDQKRPTDAQGSTPVAGEKSGDEKQGGEKPKGDKTAGEEPAGDKPGEKSSGEKPSGSKPGSKGADKDNPAGEKSDSDKPGGEKPSGDKSGDEANSDKPGNSPSGQKSDGNKPSGDKSDSGEKGGEKPDGDKKGAGEKGDKGSGEKPAGDQAGGEKSSGDKPAGEKGGDKKPGGEKAGEKPGGDKSGGDKSDGDKSGDGKQSGDKSSDAKKGSRGDSKSDSEGESSGKGSGKSPGKGAPSSQGSSTTGGGNNSTPGQTENPQPGGGENQNKGPVTKNDDPARDDSPHSRSATPDYSNEGSELVLERLGEQLDKGEVDPELLKKLGWTRDELEQFVKEFQGPAPTDASKGTAGDKSRTPKKPAAPGKTTVKDKRVQSTSRRPGQTAQDALGENYEGRRTKPAPEYEDHIRAYNMSQSKSDKPASPPAGSKPK
jgi:hypothetical protein